MAGMIKLILLMTLAAISFLRQDRVDALICTNESPFRAEAGTTAENCPDIYFCYTSVHRVEGITLGCRNIDQDEKLDNKLCADGGLGEDPNILAKFCYCNLTDFCNSLTPNLPSDFVRYPVGSGPHPTTSARPTTGSVSPPSASDRVHGKSSSSLSLCVLPIFLAIIFFGKP